MKIVITDGFTLNPGDLDWSPLHVFGTVDYYDRTAPGQVLERCLDANIIITNKTPIQSQLINESKHLQMIAVTATGYNVIDIAAAKAKGIPVCNVPVYGTDSVAQHVFALLLELTNNVGVNARDVAQGQWSKSIDWAYTAQPLTELNGKTFGIVGFGRIGQRVAALASAFGMEVIFYNKGKSSELARHVSLEQLFAESDIVSLHCPLTAENEGFVNQSLLQTLKPSAYLINTARGQLINESDLAAALRTGKIAGAALDVLSKEPPPNDHPLIGIPQCIITPHNAWMSVEARQRLMHTTIENVRAFINGTVQHNVAI